DDDLGLAYGLAHLGSATTYTREFDQAAEALGEAIALARGACDPPAISTVLSHLGILAYFQGQPDRATEILRECLTIARTEQRADHRRFSVGRALTYLGRALSEQGKFGEAMEAFEKGVTGPEARVAGVIRSMLLDWTAAVFGATGEPSRAARL